MTPKGIRLCNPGNIRLTRVLWQGEATTQLDPEFITFNAPEWGLRAIAKILLSYRAHGLNTVRDIVGRWAPAVENDTAAYVKAVANAVGVGPDTPLDLRNPGLMAKLVKAIVHQENGQQPYASDLVDHAVSLAGVGQ